MIELSSILQKYITSSFFISVFISYLSGILTSLSPCVYPLIPIVSGLVGSSCIGEKTRKKAFLLSIVYVFGMAMVYSALGMISALTGTLFGKLSTNPWIIIGIANLIIFMALIMLDVIPFSGFFLNVNSSKKGFIGAFVLGASSSFLISPCTFPVIGVILMYVATKQNFITGGALLFFFSLGMGTLLILVGTFSGFIASLPKPGTWMMVIKKGLGIMMIILAELFLIKAGTMFY